MVAKESYQEQKRDKIGDKVTIVIVQKQGQAKHKLQQMQHIRAECEITKLPHRIPWCQQ